MSDSERIQELEAKLRAWRRGALALAGGTLLVATAGVTVAQSLSDSREVHVPAKSIVLEIPATGDWKIDGNAIEYDFSASSTQISGRSLLKWGAGYSLTTGAGYQMRLERLEKGKKEVPVRITLTPTADK